MPNSLRSRLDEIVQKHRNALQRQVAARRREMEENSLEHLRLYELLGFAEDEGRKIDLYQNIGRFVYKYAGALIEEATVAVISELKGGRPLRIPNTVSSSPKQFAIDCFVEQDNKAHEIKWRDATTDGDHVYKERSKVQCIVAAGMIPVRVMFYMPNRKQAVRIQLRIIETYRASGEAYVNREAWNYIREYTGFDLYGHLYERTKDVRL